MAKYIKGDIDNSRLNYKNNSKNKQILTTSIRNMTVRNVYKPPKQKIDKYVNDYLVIYVGDFNSYNMVWGT